MYVHIVKGVIQSVLSRKCPKQNTWGPNINTLLHYDDGDDVSDDDAGVWLNLHTFRLTGVEGSVSASSCVCFCLGADGAVLLTGHFALTGFDVKTITRLFNIPQSQ